MAKKQLFKFYAVRKGWKTGVFDSWHDGANEATEGFPGARFKGFYTRKEAEDWLAGKSEEHERRVAELLAGHNQKEGILKKTLFLLLLSGAPLFAQTLEFSKLETRMLRANWNTISVPVGQAEFAAKITKALSDTTAKLDKNQAIAVASAFEDKGWFAGADSFVVAYREYRGSVKFKTESRRKFIEQFLPNFDDQLALSNAWAKIRKFLAEPPK